MQNTASKVTLPLHSPYSTADTQTAAQSHHFHLIISDGADPHHNHRLILCCSLQELLQTVQ